MAGFGLAQSGTAGMLWLGLSADIARPGTTSTERLGTAWHHWDCLAQPGPADVAQLGTAQHHQRSLAQLGTTDMAQLSTAWHCWHGLAQPGTSGMVWHSLALPVWHSSAQPAAGTPTLKHFLPSTLQHQPRLSPSVPAGAWHSLPPHQGGFGVPRSGVPGCGGEGGTHHHVPHVPTRPVELGRVLYQ